jgi:hypothetical protein
MSEAHIGSHIQLEMSFYCGVCGHQLILVEHHECLFRCDGHYHCEKCESAPMCVRITTPNSAS